MLLREWMYKNKHTCKTLSKVIGTSVRNVEKWSRGEHFPKTPMLIKIEECTQGEVTEDDLYKLRIKRRPLKKKIKVKREIMMDFSIKELRHIFDAVEQHIYATEERIKDNYAFDQHSDTHICERNLGELNDLRGKILNNIKGGQNA